MFDTGLFQGLLLFIGLTLPFALAPIFIALVDFVTVIRARYKKVPQVTRRTTIVDDFNILIPIFGNLSYLKNVEFLKQYGDKVILCTTTKESKEFNERIDELSREFGFKVFRSPVILASKKHKPNPWKLFHMTLHNEVGESIVADTARDEIIRDSFDMVNAKYCIFLDGDTVADGSLERLVGLFEEEGYDIASVRVLASKKNTMMEKLQSIEYELAMDSRRVYPWLTSGASMVARTTVIKDIMRHHSLFFSGGDIEIGKLAKLLKYNVGHIPFNFYTDVPETFRAWFRQRRAWFGGGFRHNVINIHSYTWRHPFFFIYTTVIVYLMTPLRWYEAIAHPWIIPIVIFIYWILLFTIRWKDRKWYFILFPIYALYQVMIIIPFGVIRYLDMAITSRNIGIIKLRHKKLSKDKEQSIIEVNV